MHWSSHSCVAVLCYTRVKSQNVIAAIGTMGSTYLPCVLILLLLQPKAVKNMISQRRLCTALCVFSNKAAKFSPSVNWRCWHRSHFCLSAEEDHSHLTWLHQSALNVLAATPYSQNQWEGWCTHSCYSELTSLVTVLWSFLHFTTNGGCSLAGRCNPPV